jgi:hypothetical protein
VAEHRFNGFNKGHTPAHCAETNGLPNEVFCHHITLIKKFATLVPHAEICDFVQSMCTGNTVFAFYLSSQLSQGSFTRTVIFFKVSKDMLAFKLMFPEIIDFIYVKDAVFKKSQVNFDKNLLRQKVLKNVCL